MQLVTGRPDREASLIKKEYCRLSASPQSLQVTPSRARPYLLREGRPIGAHLWDSGGQPSLRVNKPHCTLRGPHTIVGGEPGSGTGGWPDSSRVRRWGLFGS